MKPFGFEAFFDFLQFIRRDQRVNRGKTGRDSRKPVFYNVFVVPLGTHRARTVQRRPRHRPSQIRPHWSRPRALIQVGAQIDFAGFPGQSLPPRAAVRESLRIGSRRSTDARVRSRIALGLRRNAPPIARAGLPPGEEKAHPGSRLRASNSAGSRFGVVDHFHTFWDLQHEGVRRWFAILFELVETDPGQVPKKIAH